MAIDPWLASIRSQFVRQKAGAEKAVAQLSADEFNRRPAPGFNSVAVILRHMSGNLISRFTGFLTTDGEKPTRDREGEFQDWPGARAELMAQWESGWAALLGTIDGMTDADLDRTIAIRSQPLAVRDALIRALDHAAGHVGQIVYIARLVHRGDWDWLSIAPGASQKFNEKMGLK